VTRTTHVLSADAHPGVRRLQLRILSATAMPYRLLAILLLLPCVASADHHKSAPEAPQRDDGLREAGWLQSIRLEPYRVRVTAKLDTGAKSNAIHATDVERFERAGVERVRFSLYKDHTGQDGAKLTYDVPIAGDVRIKRSAGKPPEERITVRLSFCINGEVMDAEFSLDNRSNFNYPVLLGREFLQEHFVVNSAKKFVYPYDCPSSKDGD
jgi:hypothetical protein